MLKNITVLFTNYLDCLIQFRQKLSLIRLFKNVLAHATKISKAQSVMKVIVIKAAKFINQCHLVDYYYELVYHRKSNT